METKYLGITWEQVWCIIWRYSHIQLQVMSMLDPKTSQMFYFTGEKNTAPNCPVELMPNFNPSAGVPSYLGSDKACSRNAIYKIPFFLEWLGPRYMQWSVNAHEARPGHHTQVSSMSSWSGYLTHVGSFRFSSEFSRLYHHNLVLAMQHIIIRSLPGWIRRTFM